MTSPQHQVEALLFSSGKPMAIEQIVELSKLEKGKAVRALQALKRAYAQRDSAIEVVEDNGRWKMTVRNEHLALVKNIVADTELSRACMETLAVIAFKYPEAFQSEVVDTRGSGAYEHIAELEHLGFVRKEPSGRTYNLRLTEKFFSYFDLQGEKDIKEVFKGARRPANERQRQLGEMEVVPVEPKKEGPVGGMEVVEVGPEQEKPTLPPEETPEDPQEPVVKTDEAHRKFLDDLDAKIAAIRRKNDENEQDPLLKRKPAEPPLEEGNPQD